MYDKSERGIQEHHQKMATKEKMAKEPHTMYKSSNDVKPNRKVLNAQHQIEKETYYYDDWWSFTLELRNKHRLDTIKKYEKEFLLELETLPEAKKKHVLENSKIANKILVENSKTNSTPLISLIINSISLSIINS